MKRWSAYLCLFLALLLPIRGALAAVMPVSHGLGHATLAMAHNAHTASHAEHPAHTTQHCTHHTPAHAGPCDTHQQHLLCDLCNGPALALSMPFSIHASVHPGTQMPRLVSFLSVSLPSEVKPPIL